MGATLSLPRRLELLAWADTCDAYIVEDDYDSDFRFNGAPLTAVKGPIVVTALSTRALSPSAWGLVCGSDMRVLPKTWWNWHAASRL